MYCSFEVHRVRGDSTHTAAAARVKAHVCEVVSMFVHAELPDDFAAALAGIAAAAVTLT